MVTVISVVSILSNKLSLSYLSSSVVFIYPLDLGRCIDIITDIQGTNFWLLDMTLVFHVSFFILSFDFLTLLSWVEQTQGLKLLNVKFDTLALT